MGGKNDRGSSVVFYNNVSTLFSHQEVFIFSCQDPRKSGLFEVLITKQAETASDWESFGKNVYLHGITGVSYIKTIKGL